MNIKQKSKNIPGRVNQQKVNTKQSINLNGLWKDDWKWILLLFAGGFLLYANSLSNQYVLDDFTVMEGNFLVKRGLSGIPEIMVTPYRYGYGLLSDNLYRPFSLIMFAIEWQISPGNFVLGHFMNVFFYALSSSILYIVLRKLFYKSHQILPLLVALLWLAHPVHTEVVANIKSRDEIMSVFFLLLAILVYLIFIDKKSLPALILCIVLYFLSLTSKEGSITMLAVFPVIGWFYCGQSDKRIFTAAVFVIPAVAYLVARNSILGHYAAPFNPSVMDNLLVAAPDIQTRLATAIMILGKYLLLLTIPYQLVSDYSFNQIPLVSWTNPFAIISLVIYLGLILFVILQWRKKSVIAFGILFMLITLSLYSNLLVLIGTSFAERLLYLPSIGFCLAAGAFMLDVLARSSKNSSSKVIGNELFTRNKLLWITAGIILVLFSIKTIGRNKEWKNEFTLFSSDVKRSPNSAHMRHYYGLALRNMAEKPENKSQYKDYLQRAIQEFLLSIRILPTYSDPHEQLGYAFYRLNQSDQALKYYQEAIRLTPNKAVTYSNLGILYFEKGDINKAFELYQKSIALDSNFEDGYYNLGSLYGMQGQYDLAIRNFNKIIQINPSNARGHQYLGITYNLVNMPELAKKHLEIARQLDSK